MFWSSHRCTEVEGGFSKSLGNLGTWGGKRTNKGSLFSYTFAFLLVSLSKNVSYWYAVLDFPEVMSNLKLKNLFFKALNWSLERKLNAASYFRLAVKDNEISTLVNRNMRRATERFSKEKFSN